MKTKDIQHLPIYLFFQQLQKNSFGLGIEAYQDLLRALQGGFGLQNRAELFQLCQILWFKPHHNLDLFTALFNTYFEEERNSYIQIVRQEIIQTKAENDNIYENNSDNEMPNDFSPPKIPDKNLNQAKDIEKKAKKEGVLVTLSIGESTSDNILKTSGSHSPYDFSFNFLENSLPFSSRKLLEIWQKLQIFRKINRRSDLNIEKTLNNIVKEGKYVQPVFYRAKKSPRPVYILIDKGGSMVAFEAMIEQFGKLLKTNFKFTEILYFYNVPEEILYQNTAYTEGITSNQFFRICRKERPIVALISDAGAARGHYNSDRIASSKEFLQKMQQNGAKCAWLNPMPEHRWSYNSAEAIASHTAMFELNLPDIQNAVQFLQSNQKRKAY